MFYPRAIFSALERELDTKEMVVITEMRQVGKTTALRHIYDLVQSANKVLLDLENPLHRKIFEVENYDAVWQNLRAFGITNTTKAYLFLDEVQNLPEISRVAKYLYDHWQVKFFLTGSSSYYLRNLFPESLAGRKLIFEMFPLTFAEYLVFRNISREDKPTFAEKAAEKNRIDYERLIPYYTEYLEFGGFPAVVIEENQGRKRELLMEIFTSYFEKDAKNLADFKDMTKLRDLILLLLPRVGARLEILKLVNILSVSRETIYNYLAFLEHTYFLSLLPRYSASIDRQAAGSKKLFLCDSGIATILGKPSQGQLLEQSVFQILRAWHSLSFYNKEEGSEIDFIADQTTALEVKTHLSRRDLSNLSRRSASLGLSDHSVVALHYSEEPRAILVTDL
jgi:uncharacterized protein